MIAFSIATTGRAFRTSMRVLRLTQAGARYVPVHAAEELARNLACWMPEDVTVNGVRATIEWRRIHFGLLLEDEAADELAAALVESWSGA